MVNWTQSDFDNWYSPTKARVPIDHPEFGNTFSYGWKYFQFGSRRAIDGNTEEIGFLDSYRWITSLVNRNVYTNGSKTLFVGCGIGATVYRILQAFPSASVLGADTSSYVQTLKDVDTPIGFDTSLITNIDITNPDALDQLKAFTGGNGKVKTVVCELVTETIPTANRAAWYSACDLLLSNGGIVAHIVMSDARNRESPEGWEETNWTWQTISEWSIEQPNHYFIDASYPNLYYVP